MATDLPFPRVIFPLLSVLALAAPAAGERRPPEGQGWQPLAVRTGPCPTALDVQGFAEGLEKKIEGGSFSAYGQTIALSQEGKKWSYRVGEGSKVALASIPAQIRFGPGPAARAVLVSQRGDRLVWTGHWGASFALEGETFHLLDTDADGNLFVPGKDSLVGPKSVTAASFAGQAWTDKSGWEIATGTEGSVWQRRVAMPRPGADPTNRAWAILQFARQRAGSGPVAWDEDKAKGCLAHARYCQTNRYMGHQEEEGKPGFSEEGKAAARQSVVGYAYSTPAEAMLEQLGTSFHAASVLHPALKTSGIGMAGNNFACDVKVDRGASTGPGPVLAVWPPHGATDVPTEFNPTGERPMPVPGKEQEYRFRIGQVVLAQLEKGANGPYSLVVRTAAGVAIEGVLTHPDQGVDDPAIKNNKDLVILAPHRPLPANTQLHAVLTVGEGSSRLVLAWRFRTGSVPTLVQHRGRR